MKISIVSKELALSVTAPDGGVIYDYHVDSLRASLNVEELITNMAFLVRMLKEGEALASAPAAPAPSAKEERERPDAADALAFALYQSMKR